MLLKVISRGKCHMWHSSYTYLAHWGMGNKVFLPPGSLRTSANRLCLTAHWTRDAATEFTVRFALRPGKPRARKLVWQWVLQTVQALAGFGATGIMQVIKSHVTNVGFLSVKWLCHCCILRGLFAEMRGSVHWNDWFAKGMAAFVC